ncbi:MAG: dienelactone hydrolase family protein [Gammaproteobacteria bacterium]
MQDADRDRPDTALISRRDFVAITVAAGLASLPAGAADATASVIEHDALIDTPDGRCDAAFLHPASGKHPGILFWTDALGLRPAMRAMARRLAAEGYAVLVPNPYYRNERAPVVDSANFDFARPEDRRRIFALMGTLSDNDVVRRDAAAFVAFLDAQAAVDTTRMLGTQGYCMGGRLVFLTAAALPDRVGSGASFHGGGLVTDDAGSPHRLLPKIKARLYVAVAADDDSADPAAKDTLRAAMQAAGVAGEVALYPTALHGWCVPDMPARNGQPVYNVPEAERAWASLLALYRKALS